MITRLFVLAGIAWFAVTACSTTPPTEIAQAVETCELTTNVHATVGDDGHTLSISGEGDTDTGLAVEDTACVLIALGVTDAVVARMDSTRALDGAQTGTWGHLRATWSFHPDAGLDIILEET